MFSLLLRVPEQDQDFVIAELWDRGTTGVVQHPSTLEAFFDKDADSAALVRYFARFSPAIRLSEKVDWVRHTEQSFPPQLIGNRFFLVPPWNEDPAPPAAYASRSIPASRAGPDGTRVPGYVSKLWSRTSGQEIECSTSASVRGS